MIERVGTGLARIAIVADAGCLMESMVRGRLVVVRSQ